jgi:hypothetical protein
MAELVVTVAETHHRWTRAVVAAALLFAVVVVAIVLSWPTGGGSKPVNDFDIPQRLITQAEQERLAWDQVGKLIEEQQSASSCRMRRPC